MEVSGRAWSGCAERWVWRKWLLMWRKGMGSGFSLSIALYVEFLRPPVSRLKRGVGFVLRPTLD